MVSNSQPAAWPKQPPFAKRHELNHELEHESEDVPKESLKGFKPGDITVSERICEDNPVHQPDLPSHFRTKLKELCCPCTQDCILTALENAQKDKPTPPPLDYLPGHPRVNLSDTSALFDFLEREFCHRDVDSVANRLWWMSKQDAKNISPLHRQIVKGRQIIPAIEPKLHLVWIDDRIYIKPLPEFLLSHAFWATYLGAGIDDVQQQQQDRVRKAALGYLRTWLYLVAYEADFRIATELNLVPKRVSWVQFCEFTSAFHRIAQEDVHERYAYGEIRLTRLNLYAPITIGKNNFHRVTYQYGAYFAQFYGPLLFGFGILSVILSGLQVALAGEQGAPTGNVIALNRISLWFSVATILLLTITTFVLLFLLIYKVVKEWDYALRSRRAVLKSGIVVKSKV